MRALILAAIVSLIPLTSHAQESNPDLALAGTYYDNGEWEKAADAYEHVAGEDALSVRDMHRHAIALVELDRIDHARRLLERIIAVTPEDPVAWFNLGIVHSHADRYANALASFRQAAELAPRWAEAWFCVGLCEVAMGSTAQAWETLDVVHALDEELALKLYESIVAEEAYRSDPAEVE